jgi:hypothetical protein
MSKDDDLDPKLVQEMDNLEDDYEDASDEAD